MKRETKHSTDMKLDEISSDYIYELMEKIYNENNELSKISNVGKNCGKPGNYGHGIPNNMPGKPGNHGHGKPNNKPGSQGGGPPGKPGGHGHHGEGNSKPEGGGKPGNQDSGQPGGGKPGGGKPGGGKPSGGKPGGGKPGGGKLGGNHGHGGENNEPGRQSGRHGEPNSELGKTGNGEGNKKPENGFQGKHKDPSGYETYEEKIDDICDSGYNEIYPYLPSDQNFCNQDWAELENVIPYIDDEADIMGMPVNFMIGHNNDHHLHDLTGQDLNILEGILEASYKNDASKLFILNYIMAYSCLLFYIILM